MSVRLLLEALITKSSSLNFLFLIMSKISQVELYRTLIKPLGRNIEDYLKETPRSLSNITFIIGFNLRKLFQEKVFYH